MLKRYGIYKNENISKTIILHLDYNGFWAPLGNLYLSSSSNLIVSRHPLSCIYEYQGFMYCPQCLTRYQVDDVKEYKNCCPSCVECPSCTSILSLSVDKNVFVYTCGYCKWQSDTFDIRGDTKEDLEKQVLEKENNVSERSFQYLLNAYKMADNNFISNKESRSVVNKEDLSHYFHLSSKSNSFAVNNDKALEHWTINDMEDIINNKHKTNHFNVIDESPLYNHLYKDSFDSNSLYDPTQIFSESLNNIPKRVKLLAKQILRCRKDAEENKLNIILQPKTLPLEGDSSQKLHKGKWWMKDASAVHSLPRLCLKRLYSLSDYQNGKGKLVIQITNPKDVPIEIQILNMSSTETESSISNEPNNYRSFLPAQEVDSIVRIVGDSPVLRIGAYEDDLLLDEELSTPNTTSASQTTTNEDNWQMKIHNNTAFVEIPLMISHNQSPETESSSKSFVSELSCLIKVKTILETDESSNYMDLFTKIFIVLK